MYSIISVNNCLEYWLIFDPRSAMKDLLLLIKLNKYFTILSIGFVLIMPDKIVHNGDLRSILS
jgi:hypothetical protein